MHQDTYHQCSRRRMPKTTLYLQYNKAKELVNLSANYKFTFFLPNAAFQKEALRFHEKQY